MRVMLALLVVLSLAPVRASIAADALPSVADLRARAAAATGPAPGNERETIIGSGSLGETKAVTFRSGNDVRRTFDHGGFHSESGSYRGEDWQQNYNGLTVIDARDPGAEKSDIATTVTHVAQPFDAYVVAELNVRAAGTRSCYDSTTFLCRRIERVDASGSVVTTIDDFATFGKQMLPKRWTVSSPESHLEMHYERTEVAENGATAADVREPDIRRPLVEFAPGVNAVTLPVTVVGNSIFVRVNAGSRVVDFVLDTGSSGIVLDPALARELGLKLSNAAGTVTAGRSTSYDAVVPELRIASLRMHDIVVSVAPLPVWHPVDTKPLGLLGFDFLAQLGVTIDYAGGTVVVTPAQNYRAPSAPATYVFPVRLGRGVPMVTLGVAGAVAERVLLDTGWDGQLGFFDYFARRYPSAFREDVGPAIGAGVGGAFTGEYFRFPDVKLGPLHFHGFIGFRVPPATFTYNADGAIGNDVLSMFTVGLDYTRGFVYLTLNNKGKRALAGR